MLWTSLHLAVGTRFNKNMVPKQGPKSADIRTAQVRHRQSVTGFGCHHFASFWTPFWVPEKNTFWTPQLNGPSTRSMLPASVTLSGILCHFCTQCDCWSCKAFSTMTFNELCQALFWVELALITSQRMTAQTSDG